MKKIKVYIQYPWKFPDSPYYQYLIDNPPKDVEYLNVKNQKGVITSKRFFLFSNLLKKIIRNSLEIFYPSLINAHLSPKGNYDLIHCAHCLSKNQNKPWVVDIEYTGQLWAVGHKVKNEKSMKKIEKILGGENCKKIITWTQLMKNDLIKDFPSLKDKVEVVYPPIPLPKVKKIKHSEINLFFVARYFYEKGGLHALEVIDRIIRKEKNVSGIIVSEIPESIRRGYSKNKKILFYPLMPQKELFEKVYSKGDIFIYPGYTDSFGFAIPEVMGCGIPVVSVDTSTRNEIISSSKNGFLIKTNKTSEELEKIANSRGDIESKRIMENIEKQTLNLIKNKRLLEKMSLNAKKEILYGKFSVKKINKQLKKIYEDAIK